MTQLANLTRKIIPRRWRPVGYLMHLVWSQANGRILKGPFTGMKYVNDIFGSVGGAYIPKILGIYEQELNSYIEKACTLNFQQIINIGGGEGYYAVGMALRNPSASVVTFEMDIKGQETIAQMAKLNSVEKRIEICGKCEPEDLNNLLILEKTLIIIDVEAYEIILLNPNKISGLKNAFILVELHDFIQKGIAEELRSRFESTHSIERIWQTERTIQDFPYTTVYTHCLPKSYIEWAVSEWRPEQMSWYWMSPHLSTAK